MCAANSTVSGSKLVTIRCGGRNAETRGGYGVGIELERVLARLKESGGTENVILDDEAALGALGALAIVDPKRVGCDVECVSGVAAG